MVGGAEGADRMKRKGRAAMDEAMHVVKESMTDTGGVGYFHVSPLLLLKKLPFACFLLQSKWPKAYSTCGDNIQSTLCKDCANRQEEVSSKPGETFLEEAFLLHSSTSSIFSKNIILNPEL